MEYFSVIGGLILLVIAGDKLVEGSVAIAERLNVSKLIIGITIVSFGTSAPELVVGIDSALSGAPEIALGNVVGSNIANILLVLGIPALFYPFACKDRDIRHSLFFMLLATILFIFLSFLGDLHIWQGLLMLSFLIGFLYYSINRAKSDMRILKHDIDLAQHVMTDMDMDPELVEEFPLGRAVIMTSLGLAGLIFGGHILVEGSVTIARTYGISEAIIGLTIVAVGTSLPELVTSVIAARNNHGDVVMGNIIGSNLFNILAIMGVTTLLTPVPIPEHFFLVEFPILLITSLMLVPIALGKIKINRLIGMVFSGFYLLYLLFLGAQLDII